MHETGWGWVGGGGGEGEVVVDIWAITRYLNHFYILHFHKVNQAIHSLPSNSFRQRYFHHPRKKLLSNMAIDASLEWKPEYNL